VADPKIFEKWGAEDNLSLPSPFIVNAHDGLYAFYTEKGGFKKFWADGGGRPPPPPPPESATDGT